MSDNNITGAEARYLEAKHRAELHAQSLPPPPHVTPRRKISAVHWMGIVVAGGIAALVLFGESDADKARKAETQASLDAVGVCQARIAASLGIRKGAVGYATPRAVNGGYQMLWPQHNARCEVRDGGVVELVIAGREII